MPRGQTESGDKVGPTAALSPDDEYDRFFNDVYPDLIKRAVRLCGSLPDAEDAAAEIMIEVRQRWAAIYDHEAYAHRSLVRRIGKIRTSSYARRTELRAPDTLPVHADADHGIEDLAGRQWVEEVLKRLPPVQGHVMRLIVGGLKYSEIAEDLNCSVENVRQHVRHARLKLRRYVKEPDPLQRGSGATTTRKEPE